MIKYSKAQEVYMLAKAHLEALEDQEKELERQYIADNSITNPDGSIPDQIYCIDDKETFDRVNEGFAKMTEDNGLWDEILEAREMLKQAEENLINWGLSIVKKDMPKSLFQTLQNGLNRYKIRKQVIDLTLKLAL